MIVAIEMGQQKYSPFQPLQKSENLSTKISTAFNNHYLSHLMMPINHDCTIPPLAFSQNKTYITRE